MALQIWSWTEFNPRAWVSTVQGPGHSLTEASAAHPKPSQLDQVTVSKPICHPALKGPGHVATWGLVTEPLQFPQLMSRCLSSLRPMNEL